MSSWDESDSSEVLDRLRTIVDVHVSGTVFLDLVFTGLSGAPAAGREVYADDLVISPGGVANVAVGLARLGLTVRLAAAFAEDRFGDDLWRGLREDEGIDLKASHRVPEWSTPLTVSMAHHHDRSMLTRSAVPPVSISTRCGLLPGTRACFTHVSWQDPAAWLDEARARGSSVFVDARWDPSGQWPEAVLDALESTDVFMPNSVEAMSYTHTHTPRAALQALSSRFDLCVVKCGSEGALAVQRGYPVIHEPALPVEAVDPTGAGDVFDAGFIYGSLAGWALEQRLRLAVLCAGLSVRRGGGACSAPTWCGIAEYLKSEIEAPGAGRWDFLREHAEGRAATSGLTHENPLRRD